MKENFIVEGANWDATILIDTELHDNPLMEAATQIIEVLFGDGPDSEKSHEIEVHMTDEDSPNLGLIVCVYKEQDRGNEEKRHYVKSKILAQNAGLTELAKLLEESEKQLE